MNSLILSSDNQVVTDSEVLKHLTQTIKVKMGDVLKVTILNRGIGKAKILEINPQFIKLEILQITKCHSPWFDLIVGVSRPQTMKKILEHATTFGANSFHFYQAALSEKSYLTSKIYESDSMSEITKLGLAQSTIYANTPDLKLYPYNPAKHFESYQQKFILDLNGKHTFLNEQIDFSKPIALSVGPERGFIQEDLDYFKTAGFKSIKISSTVLRVEHAIYSAISQLEMLKGDLC
jgi:RsmE family RNA methyltransferase